MTRLASHGESRAELGLEPGPRSSWNRPPPAPPLTHDTSVEGRGLPAVFRVPVHPRPHSPSALPGAASGHCRPPGCGLVPRLCKMSGLPCNRQLSTPLIFPGKTQKLAMCSGRSGVRGRTKADRKAERQRRRKEGRERAHSGRVSISPLAQPRLSIARHSLGWWSKHPSGIRREKRWIPTFSWRPLPGLFQAHLSPQQCLHSSSSSSSSR